MDPRAVTAVSQLVNCIYDRFAFILLVLMICVAGYLLLSIMSMILFRVIQNTLLKNPAAQEAIIGAALAVLAFADVRLFFPTCSTLITLMYLA